MSSKASSFAAAVQDAAGDNPEQSRFFAPAEQLDLLRDGRGKLAPDALRVVRRNSGRGRPPGARNKRSGDLAKWFVQQYGHPLAVFGEIMSMPPDVLYEQMVLAQGGEAKGKRITGKDVFDLKMQAAREAAPYVEGKQPLAVNITGKADAVLFIPGVNAPEGFSGEQMASAVERLGIEAIERGGIRLHDGRLIEDGEFDEVEPDADESGQP